jgi:hypothetical protein
MYHVKEITTVAPGGLDLNIADEEEFSPDKLRANVERLYMTIVSSPYLIELNLAYLMTGHRYDGIWQTHRPDTVMARDT